ncbi:MAG: DNA-directed RNA polymerase subunit alpha [Clostridia bacterium]|nr:DNA-directed RNA polymerase subunit alpha [Clostridia bacterium]
MLEIEKPRIETVEITPDGTYGKFVMEPLERGYATTLGNSMRRVLLSILPGAAVTSVKIDGVVHEFSTIPGVKEDVTEIVLNLKGLICKLHSDTVKKIYIEAEGPCEVTAASIKADSEVEILNPELHIATLDAGAKLNMEMTLDKGRGYVPAEQNKPEQNIIGVIPVDSIYTPVLKVNPTVDNTRVGNVTDKGKLTLEVWTDGSIRANEAVSMSAKVLIEHLEIFLALTEGGCEGQSIMAEKNDSEKEKVLDLTSTFESLFYLKQGFFFYIRWAIAKR